VLPPSAFACPNDQAPAQGAILEGDATGPSLQLQLDFGELGLFIQAPLQFN
jgi:hypothetical protein